MSEENGVVASASATYVGQAVSVKITDYVSPYPSPNPNSRFPQTVKKVVMISNTTHKCIG